jgi:hypothetical protein
VLPSIASRHVLYDWYAARWMVPQPLDTGFSD